LVSSVLVPVLVRVLARERVLAWHRQLILLPATSTPPPQPKQFFSFVYFLLSFFDLAVLFSLFLGQ